VAVRVEFADFSLSPKGPPMTKTRMSLAELPERYGEGDLLGAVAGTVLQLCLRRGHRRETPTGEDRDHETLTH
jgi:hypothetical protein